LQARKPDSSSIRESAIAAVRRYRGFERRFLPQFAITSGRRISHSDLGLPKTDSHFLRKITYLEMQMAASEAANNGMISRASI
jgi:hypothetical protein